MTRVFAVVAAVAMLGSTSCKKSARPDIPIYPDAQGLQGQGTMKTEKTVVFNSRWFTGASGSAIKAFYDNALLARPGWAFSGSVDERFQFAAGKFTDQGGSSYWPTDETKPAGLVTVLVGMDRSVIDVWQAIPIE